MAKVQDCLEFDRLWNDRLDDGAVAAGTDRRGRFLAEHSAGCDRCRNREAVFAEMEAALRSPALAPLATPEAIARWVAAASAACPPSSRPAPASTPAEVQPGRSHFKVIGRRLGQAVAVAASVLVGTNLIIPILDPLEAATPAPHDWAMPTPFEEACAEASTMAQDLVVKVSAPASRISSDALGLVESGPPAFKPTQYEVAEAGTSAATDPVEAGKVELISGSARHAFRFLTGSTTDELDDPEIVGGY